MQQSLKKCIFLFSIFAYSTLVSCSENNLAISEKQREFSVMFQKSNLSASVQFLPEMIVPIGKIVSSPPPKPNLTNVLPFNKTENDSRNLVLHRNLRILDNGIDALPQKEPPFLVDDFSVKQQAPPNPNWGTKISQVPNPVGNRVAVTAAHEVVSIAFSSATYEQLLYAPTLMPPNNALIESTLYYWRPVGASTTTIRWGAWDHSPSSGGWGYTEAVNSSFNNKYIRTQSDGRKYFYSYIEKTSSSHTWRVLLYNYLAGGWEQKYSANGGSQGGGYSYGWDMHEPKFFSGNTVYCPVLPSIKMRDLEVWNGASWSNVTASNGSQLQVNNVTCNNWSYNMISNYFQWVVN